jgi:hypothetical protein
MLTTIDEVKKFIGGQDDKDDLRITACLTRASAIIERYCRRTFLQATYTGEMYDGSGTDILTLRNFPIIGTPTVLEGGTALVVGTDPVATPTLQVIVDADYGRLRRYLSEWVAYPHYYKLTYDAGFAAVPEEIIEAAIELTLIMLKEKERAGLSQHTTGAVTSTYIRTLPQSSQWALDLHRDLTLGRAA